MLRLLFLLLLVALMGTLALGAYLSPDDLSRCGPSPSAANGCQKADAIVAVSGGNTSIRAAEAINLYKQGWGKYLVFSGAAKDMSGPSNADVMKQQAESAGVPASVIKVDGSSQTTHQNAEQIDQLVKSDDVSNIIVVTSPYHQRRAGLEFERIMGNNATVRNHPAANDPDWPTLWWVTPRGWWLAGSEIIKIVFTHVGESS